MINPGIARSISLAIAFQACFSALVHAEPIAVKDMQGRPLRLESPAERLITIPIPLASTVIALDGTINRLVGMHPLAKSAIETSYLGTLFPEAAKIESSIINGASPEGFAPNVEAVAALRPDLVVQWGGQGEDIVAPLENAGLKTGLVVYGDESRAREMLGFVGSVIGADEKARMLLDWRNTTWNAISEISKTVAEKERPKVVYLLRAKNGLQVAGGGTYYDSYIKLAGGINPAAGLSNFKIVNTEQMAQWDPDVILLNNFEDGLDLSAITDDPILSATSAARNKRVYKLPMGGYRWDPPSQESPLTWMWLATLLHPDRFAFDPRAEIKAWYPKIYGATPSDAEIDGILRIKMNGGSAGYDRMVAK